jgi:hypothetical protein
VLPAPVLTLPAPVPWSYPIPTHSTICLSRQDLARENQQLRDNLAIAVAHIKQQEEIIRGNNAQMLFQWLHVSKLDEARVAAAKKSRHTNFPGGRGQELTGAVFMDASQARSDANAAEAAEKAVRMNQAAIAKVLKAAQEAAWAQETEASVAAVADWTSKYAGMTKSQMMLIEAPKKPRRRLKAEVYAEAEALLSVEAGEVPAPDVEMVGTDEDFTDELEDVRSEADGSEYSPYAEV